MARVVILALSLVLAGCQTVRPHVRPDLPTAPAYPAEYGGYVILGDRATQVGWRDFFEDPRLEALLTAALTRNRDLAVAVAQIEEARDCTASRMPTGCPRSM